MRCLVTGAAGFVGSTIIDRLLADGHEVIGVDSFVDYYPRKIKENNLLAAKEHTKFSFFERDICDPKFQELVGGVEWIFHQAAQAGVRASWGKSFAIYTHNNISATQELLELATKEPLRSSLKKFVYASSSSVYGTSETLPTTEKTLPTPISPYGVTKLAAEHLAVLYSKEFGVPTASLRYFTVFGPRQRPDMAFNKFISAALRGEQIGVYGNGEQSRDFTYIDDIVAANILAAKYNGSELVFNIGGGSQITVNQVLDLLGKVLGRKLNIAYSERQRGDALHTGADTSLAKRELLYNPTVQVEEGLRREANWLESLIR